MVEISTSEKKWQPGDDLTADQASEFEIERPRPSAKKVPIWKRVRGSSLLAFIILFGALFLRWVDPLYVETLRNKTFDTYQRLSPTPIKPYPVAIIDLDEKALA